MGAQVQPLMGRSMAAASSAAPPQSPARLDPVTRSEAWLGQLLAPCDIASLVVWRVGWGAMIAWWAWDYLTSGRVRSLYVQPKFHFTYALFDWVHPWPGPGMYLHFLALAAMGLLVACGCLYRLASLLWALGFTYVFLLEKTNYQNHYYLMLLIGWWMPWLPLHRAVSVDAAWRPSLAQDTAPAWSLWVLRFHLALPYFFGGVAKLDPDWLSGMPMRQILATHAHWPLVGPLLTRDAIVALFTWGGLLFDLTIVPLLVGRTTRALGYAWCAAFHLLNSVLFEIHLFPWLMLLGSTLFFEPDWPRRLLGARLLSLHAPQPQPWRELPAATRLALAAACLYVVFHIWWPLRHHLYPGDASWTEQGHFFAWRMMLRNKQAVVRYYLTDPQLGRTWNPDLRPYLSEMQASRFPRDPEMILELGQFLARQYEQKTGRRLEVRALALASLNGRKPQLLIDPQVDLTRLRRGQLHRPWVLPDSELLPEKAWDLPPMVWERFVTLPAMPPVTGPPDDWTP